ncbi:hypothetical protein BCV70DRAFT_212913 [Testicularia cyperi]|uniref:CBM1 domain-containing protein n=1 Tax=Testicularia cyperi TaxID=1882483 RepID=A0A317XJS0_9BASI|nr:hypothetical protein BCV70DRAFT_212913 [Testicularia cyperi]
MRVAQLSYLLALLLAASCVLAQLDSLDAVAEPFERSLDSSALVGEPIVLSERDLLEARQATNASASASGTSTASAAESTSTGSAPAGGEATITESTCSMTNKLSVNQQASWGQGIVNTCCGFATGTQCWYRNQSTVSGNEECEIPDCSELESEDASKMLGFVPLTSTNGQGKYGNIFLSLGQLSAGVMAQPVLWITLLVASLSIGVSSIL